MLAFIIYGWSRYPSTLGQSSIQCPICCAHRACDVTQHSTWVTLYFIPVIPLGKSQPQLTCRGCHGEFPAPAEVAHRHPGTNLVPWVLGGLAMLMAAPVMLLVLIGVVASISKPRPVARAPESGAERELRMKRDMADLQRHGVVGMEIEFKDGTKKQFGDVPSAPTRPRTPFGSPDVKWTPAEPAREVPAAIPATPRVETPNPGTRPEPPATPSVPPPAAPRPAPVIPRPREEPAAEPNVWNVQPDPPAKIVKLNPSSLAIGLGVGDDLVFPPAPSPFVAIRRLIPKQQLELWDWTKGRKAADLPGFTEPTHHMVLNAEGTLAAVRWFARAGAQEAIQLWSFKTGKGTELTWPDASPGLPRFALLAPQERVVVLSSDQKTILVMDAGGRTVWHKSDAERVQECVCASPTGRYIALVAGDRRTERLWVVDLNEQQIVGNIALPPLHKTYAVRTTRGLCWSPDGSRLAGLFDELGSLRLVVWDVSTGQPAFDPVYERQRISLSYRGQLVEWMDNGGLLLGGDLIIGPTGELEGRAPPSEPGVSDARRVIDSRRILMVKNKRLMAQALERGPAPAR